MPKDPTKNVGRYKTRGGAINEYEYHENQQALVQDEPLTSTKSTNKKAKKATSNTMRGASAKKLAARKAARKLH